MTKEELMQPRWKVIEGYPFSPPIHAVGTIIEGSLAPEGMEAWEDKYPHLFKKLEWHEERKTEDMPEYVFWSKSAKKEITPVERWENTKVFGMRFSIVNDKWRHIASECSIYPATESEYQEYMRKNNSKITTLK